MPSKPTVCPRGHSLDEPGARNADGRCAACRREYWRAKHPARPKPTRAEILWSKIQRDPASSCWLWTGYRGQNGYGQWARVPAHRAVYELLVGPIPDGLTLDHLCRNTVCVNPDHLDPVTLGENVMRGEGPCAKNARKTHCPQGHPYDEVNTWRHPRTGHRACKECNRQRALKVYYERGRDARAAARRARHAGSADRQFRVASFDGE